MADSLTVFGTDYTNVAGIKATGTGNGTLTYIRPQGTKSISANGTGIDVAEYASVDVSVQGGIDMPTFTLGEDELTGDIVVTCDKTYSECWDIQATTFAAILIIPDYVDLYLGLNCAILYDQNDNPFLRYLGYDSGMPSVQIDYMPNGEIVFSEVPQNLYSTLNIVSNGTYEADWGTLYSEVNVNVPTPTPSLQAKTNIAPSTSSQTITADSGYDGLSSVQINAMPSGTAGTPTATKGSVSNHSVSVTPSVTNTTGYITGSTKTGTAVSVSASELVSGSYTVSASGNHDVTNYASATVAAGGATASATKGSVSNNSITVTPSVTRTAGYVTAGSANGTAVTVSASELVSGSQTITSNNTYDVTNLASVVVNVAGSGGVGTLLTTYNMGTISTSSTQAADTGKSISVSPVNDYDLLIVETSVNSVTNNRHTATVGLIFLTASSTVGTKNGAGVATMKWNSRISSNGTTTTRQGTTAYGIYPNSCSVSTSNSVTTATIPMYQRYNSTSTGTINGTYTTRVYGVNLYDLIGG